MSKDPVFDEPMRQLILSMSAWRRLEAKAEELAASEDWSVLLDLCKACKKTHAEVIE